MTVADLFFEAGSRDPPTSDSEIRWQRPLPLAPATEAMAEGYDTELLLGHPEQLCVGDRCIRAKKLGRASLSLNLGDTYRAFDEHIFEESQDSDVSPRSKCGLAIQFLYPCVYTRSAEFEGAVSPVSWAAVPSEGNVQKTVFWV